MTWQKVQIKSEKLTLFGGIYSIMEQFEALFSSNHRFHLEIGEQVSAIIRNMFNKLNLSAQSLTQIGR